VDDAIEAADKSIPPTILAIDTSCDDTSVAVTRGWEVLSNVIASQVELHREYGGVFPTVAKQAHKENIAPTVARALDAADRDWSHIDAIAVTQGPGLAPALEVGIAHAKQLAQKHELPLIPVNHLEGHLLSVLARPSDGEPIEYQLPALGMIISGGHSQFVLVRALGEYETIGQTVDDAAGEALDKFGRMLDLDYPAGPAIEQLARGGDPAHFDFPLPMTDSGDYNLSFSGLKTYARNLVQQLQASEDSTLLSTQTQRDLCASFQRAVFRHLMHKLERILTDLAGTPQAPCEIWLGGGVAANQLLRKMIAETSAAHAQRQREKGLEADEPPLRVPYTLDLCRDNGGMIGVVCNTQKSIHANTSSKLERKPRLKL
jgi:N6-L-threonylcarbamoyladenine synthase